LGEAPLPAAPRSVFEYMSQKDRERLQRAAASIPGPSSSESTSAPSTMPPPPPPLPATQDIPRLEPYIAKAALLGFQPFTHDPVKHERYTTYLNSQAHVDGTSHPPLQPFPGQTTAAFNKEVTDFAAAGAVFKPLSAAMAGRFTSAASVERGPTAEGGLYQPTFTEEPEKPPTEEKPEEKPADDPQTNAARLGMYGPMTRTVAKWAPAQLLCKRFGVKDPNPEPDPADDVPPAAESAASASTSHASLASITLPETLSSESVPHAEDSQAIRPSGSRDLSNIGLGEDEFQAQDVLTYERPSMDVFKAIFASDDEDSDDEDVAAKPAPVGPSLPPVRPSPAPTVPTVSNVQSAPAPSAQPEELPITSQAMVDSGSVDLSAFKPTFTARTDRERRHDGDGRTKERKKKDKKTLVSFDDGPDAEDSGLGAPKAKKRKEKHKEKKRDRRAEAAVPADDDDDMWVEKAPPEVVKSMPAPSAPPATERTRTKGRPTAADLM
jgi:G patch domain-containing protein 1